VTLPLEADLPEGITHKRSQQARAIAKYPEIVEKVKAQGYEEKVLSEKRARFAEAMYSPRLTEYLCPKEGEAKSPEILFPEMQGEIFSHGADLG
jgi:hypothetical protein